MQIAFVAHNPLTYLHAKATIICRTTFNNEPKIAWENAASFKSTKSSWSRMSKYNNGTMCTVPLVYSSIRDDFPPMLESKKGYYSIKEGILKIKKRLLSKSTDLEELIMIDTVQRLGLEDYFQQEINFSLQKHHAKFCRFEVSDDLYEVALLFRLLRQDAFHASADIFNKFKDNDGKFKQQLCKDEKGLLSLYEASQLSIQGEDILDEASEFCVHELFKASLINTTNKSNNARIINNILRNPYHKTLARIMAKSFQYDIDAYFETVHELNSMKDWINEVKVLSRFDLEAAQMTHADEIRQLSRWGKELNSTKELSFARIEPIKWYMWALGALPGPNMAEERVELAKAVSFVYIIDDIFDVYGTPEELSLFTQVINRWEYGDTHGLPNYMKVCFNALRKQTNDFSYKVLRKHGYNPEPSLRKVWANMCNAFVKEAKWTTSNHLPTSEEYLKNGIISSGIHAVFVHVFFLLGQQINNNTADELLSLPSIVASTATIVRLWNDVGVDKDENREGNDLSYIDCYIKEHKGCSTGSARQHINDMISNAWKCLNEEYMNSTSPFSKDFKSSCLNLARMVPIVYNRDKSHHLLSIFKLLNSSLDSTNKNN